MPRKGKKAGIMQSSKELWVGWVEREREKEIRNKWKEREDKVRKENE